LQGNEGGPASRPGPSLARLSLVFYHHLYRPR
jgi:hypothetical protein